MGKSWIANTLSGLLFAGLVGIAMVTFDTAAHGNTLIPSFFTVVLAFGLGFIANANDDANIKLYNAERRASREIADLYFEAHVTIEPVFDVRREVAAEIARMHGFKLAHLLMQKRAEDTPERSKHDTFMTGHGRNRLNIEYRTKELVEHLTSAGYKVWRYKIEDTLCDSRSADIWGLLEKTDAA